MEKCRNKIDPWWKLNPGEGGGGGVGGVRFRVGAPEQRDVKRNESGS